MLHAFRHQRKNRHSSHGRDWNGHVAVLNAFRHQRKNRHASRNSFLPIVISCSTPFGIRGRIGPKSLGSLYLEMQCSTPFGIRGRIGVRGSDAEGERWDLCSTPFGIRGRIGARTAATEPVDKCAQRLSASEEESELRSRFNDRALMCSTPFGIRGRISFVRYL